MKDENMEWELEAPVLAALPRTTPYRVPDNYFEGLKSQTNSLVQLSQFSKNETSGFLVPNNYFNELTEQINSRIAIDEFSLMSENGFKTPEHYFENLQNNILGKTTNLKPQTKVTRLWNSDFMRYAAAACFILLVASGLYVDQQNTIKQTQNNELANESMLYYIDESVIVEHLKESQTATTISVSQAEMENYLIDNYSSNDLSNSL